uniref:Transmembrane protein 159 n=1 Tax=Electrophorus electricus TaxID=8005 RepID=A0A4W4EBX2_ELEEL
PAKSEPFILDLRLTIAELLNTKFGKYLSDHPFFALVLLVFGVIASVPIGLFLVFAVVTFVAVTVFFVFVESKLGV